MTKKTEQDKPPIVRVVEAARDEADVGSRVKEALFDAHISKSRMALVNTAGLIIITGLLVWGTNRDAGFFAVPLLLINAWAFYKSLGATTRILQTNDERAEASR